MISGRLEVLEARMARTAFLAQDEVDARILMAIGKAMEARDGHPLPLTPSGQTNHSGAGMPKPNDPKWDFIYQGA